MTEGTAVGVDVGATKAVAVRVSPDGSVLARETVRTPAADVEAVSAATLEVARSVVDATAVTLGIGAAGIVELGTGRLRYAPNIAWRDVDLREVLAPLGLPTVVDNDCTAATVGELLAGAGHEASDFLYVGVGTGLGGGIVSDRQVRRGAHGFAGEIGHIIVEPGGVRCGCGNRGCWETVASGSAVSRLGKERLGVGGHEVVTAAHGGDDAAIAVLAEVGTRLGEGIAGLVNVLDPAMVVVGGGAALGAGDLMLDPARAAYSGAVEAPEYRPAVPIVPAALGEDNVAIGAALWALDELG
jgi:glucokinase